MMEDQNLPDLRETGPAGRAPARSCSRGTPARRCRTSSSGARWCPPGPAPSDPRIAPPRCRAVPWPRPSPSGGGHLPGQSVSANWLAGSAGPRSAGLTLPLQLVQRSRLAARRRLQGLQVDVQGRRLVRRSRKRHEAVGVGVAVAGTQSHAESRCHQTLFGSTLTCSWKGEADGWG